MNKSQRSKLYKYYLNQILEKEFTYLKEQIRSKKREIEQQSCEGCQLKAGSIKRHSCVNNKFSLEEEIKTHHKILYSLLLNKKITKRNYLLLKIYLPYKR